MIHPHNKSVPKTSEKGGKKNQYGENRVIVGSGGNKTRKAGHP